MNELDIGRLAKIILSGPARKRVIYETGRVNKKALHEEIQRMRFAASAAAEMDLAATHKKEKKGWVGMKMATPGRSSQDQPRFNW